MPASFLEAKEAVERIRTLAATRSPIVVAVDGRSGVGKSTLAEWMASELGAAHIDQDDFYTGGDFSEWAPLSPKEKADRVIDWRRVKEEAVLPLRHNQPASWRPFDWDTMQGLVHHSMPIQPAPVILLDGAYSARPELADCVDLTILVVLDDATRQERLRQREGEAFVTDWQRVWDEAEDCYFTEVRPPKTFDIVINRPS